MHRRAAMLVLGFGALMTVGLAACGDDEDTLTEEEFVEQGNAICDEGTERTDAIFDDLGDEPTEEQLLGAVQDVADDVESQIDDLRELAEPDEMSDDVDVALDGADEAVEALRDTSIEDLQTGEDPFADSRPALREVGLASCAEG
jgi:hypothetical protein